MEYPSIDEIIESNKDVLRAIKTKKADSHKILSHGALQHIVDTCSQNRGDAYSAAACLLTNLIQSHPFASGNRRTAWIVTESFLKRNNMQLNVDNSDKQAKPLQGIREKYYSEKEVRDWLITGKIREFER